MLLGLYLEATFGRQTPGRRRGPHGQRRAHSPKGGKGDDPLPAWHTSKAVMSDKQEAKLTAEVRAAAPAVRAHERGQIP